MAVDCRWFQLPCIIVRSWIPHKIAQAVFKHSAPVSFLLVGLCVCRGQFPSRSAFLTVATHIVRFTYYLYKRPCELQLYLSWSSILWISMGMQTLRMQARREHAS